MNKEDKKSALLYPSINSEKEHTVAAAQHPPCWKVMFTGTPGFSTW